MTHSTDHPQGSLSDSSTPPLPQEQSMDLPQTLEGVNQGQDMDQPFADDPGATEVSPVTPQGQPQQMKSGRVDTFLSKTPIAPCYCQMMGRTLKEKIRITQYNNPTKAGKYSLEDLFRASDNIPHTILSSKLT